MQFIGEYFEVKIGGIVNEQDSMQATQQVISDTSLSRQSLNYTGNLYWQEVRQRYRLQNA